MSVNKELQQLQTDVSVMKAEVVAWMNTTTEYRKFLCKKIDDMSEKINILPCRERKGIYDSVKVQVRLLWVFIGAIILAIVAEWIRLK